MKIFNNISIPKNYKSCALAIGNFDGVHKGHQKVFKEAKKYAKKEKIKFGVLTFTPLPLMFFNKKIKHYRLTSENQKIQLLKRYKVDFVINLNFNKKFSKITYEYFIEKIIFKKINPQLIFVSNNFRFGNKRKGNVRMLKNFSRKFDYKLINITPFKYKGTTISSTKIRRYFQNGNLDLANKLLSRTWSIEGEVQKGKKIGKKLGYPTCNINIRDYILPKIGVYAVKVSIEDKKKVMKGVAYLGYQPTFRGKKLLLEVNIFDFKKNLYKKRLQIYFLKFVRGDRKFKNAIGLVKQINKDVTFAKKHLKVKLVL